MPDAPGRRLRWALLIGIILSVTYAYCSAERAAHLRQSHAKQRRRPQHLLPPHHRPLSSCRGSAAAAAMSSEGLKESYSLWAMPKGRLGDQLRAEIAALAERQGAPAFPPHVTVLGDIERPREEMIRMTKELAAQVKKYRINFVDVTRGSIFYQCVYLLVAKDEGTMAAAATARKVFDRTTPPYMPHLSLLYSDIDEAERDKVVKYERDRLYGESSGYDTLLVENGYEVGSFAIWYTPTEDKSLKSWCLVDEIELSG
ncbi:hypothetical protein GPECTOR_83g306 [Gonium pectorale]|uniref:Cyclic phosphodiesterase n=1 Tax=Gonium pectorale TaxID=33097 RepID=A0A150G1J6_GONPE|nr:hypothetical protein GPECTOR_83g306 [Gonium pectorale]|eukprot:KXZ43694.1 hypothetical protein GPECTOR_83g306 [Gonium pectorale]